MVTTARRIAPRTRRGRILTVVIVAALVVLAYVVTLVAYTITFDEEFTEPRPAADEVAIVLAPVRIEPEKQAITADVLLYPGADLVDADGRLRETIVVDTAPPILTGKLVYKAGTQPSPKPIDVAALGSIASYPFDRYDVKLRLEASALEPGADPSDLNESDALPLGADLSLFTNVPGWTDRDLTTQSNGTSATISFMVVRSTPTIIIALILVTLMASFGVLATLVAIASLRVRLTVAMANAAWLTASLFALITLRDRMPGHPPLGSWIDILVYFWVIVATMLAVILTISMLLSKEARMARVPSSE